jgi:Ion transport protein
MLRIYQNANSIKDPYVIINMIGTICCWTTIFFDMIENDSSSIFRIFMMVRVIRAIIRILEVFPLLRNPFEIFINTIPSLQKLFFPLIILMLFYAIAGMALFSGASKYRCVEEGEHH